MNWIWYWIISYFKGFSHEHNRHDRDKYVTLTNVENPQTNYPCQNKNYADLDANKVNDYDVDYDYCSILHYKADQWYCRITPKQSFSCTIKGQKVTEIGQRIWMSEKDIEEINKRYNCDNTNGGTDGGSNGKSVYW